MGESAGAALSNVIRGVQTLRTDFLQTLQTGPTDWVRHVMVQTSSDASEKYLFGGTAPIPRKWIDERRPGGLHAKIFDVVNERWENSLSVDIPSLERDKIGFFRMKIQEMGIRMVNLPIRLLNDFRLLGISEECWDGSTFYDEAHEFRKSGEQANKFAQTGVEDADVVIDYYVGKHAMLGWKDDQGEVDDAAASMWKPVIVYGQQMDAVMQRVFNTDTLVNGGRNPLYKAAELELNMRISGTGYCIDNLGKVVKPFGFQEEIPLRLSNTDPTDERAWNTGFIGFGTEWRGNVFFGDPSTSVLIGSLT